MNVTITSRHMEMTPALKDHIEGGLVKIKDHFDKVMDIDVVLCVEKHRHIAEVNLHANGLRINAKESSEDMYSSVDSAISKVDRQVGKHRDRIKRHQPRISKEERSYRHNIIEFDDTDQVEPAKPHHVIVHEDQVVKTLSVDEAALQLELIDDTFVVFSNATTHEINVIYERPDGKFGHLEPHE